MNKLLVVLFLLTAACGRHRDCNDSNCACITRCRCSHHCPCECNKFPTSP